jgi:hypothetical protein
MCRLSAACLLLLSLALPAAGAEPSGSPTEADLRSDKWWRDRAQSYGEKIQDLEIRSRFWHGLTFQLAKSQEWDAAMGSASRAAPSLRVSVYVFIAKEQAKHGDSKRGFDTLQHAIKALDTNQKNKGIVNFQVNNVIEACFAVGSAEQAIALAEALPPEPLLDIRPAVQKVVFELAKSGKPDQAVEFAKRYGPRAMSAALAETAKGCASAARFDDALRWAAKIDEPVIFNAAYRDILVEQVKAGTLNEARAVAAKIADEKLRVNALGLISAAGAKKQSPEEVLAAIAAAESREEKLAIYGVLFDKLVDAKSFDDAEAAIDAMVKIVKESPRPQVSSAFGRSDDQLTCVGIRGKKLPLARAIHAAGDKDRSIRLLQSVEPEILAIPDDSSFGKTFLVMEVLATRGELGLIAGADRVVDSLPEPMRPLVAGGLASMQARAGDIEAAIKTIERYSSDKSSPASLGGVINALIHSKDLNGAKRVVSLLPENPKTIYDFRSLGSAMIEAGRAAELDAWIRELPPGAPQAFACLGAADEIRNEVE